MNSLRTLAIFVAFLGSTAAVAGPRDDALEAVAKCASLADAHARLACYDAAAPAVKSALAAPSAAPETATASAQPAPKEQESSFGLPDLFGGRPAQTTPQQFGSETVPKPPPPPKPAPPSAAAVAANAPQPPPTPPEPEELDSITADVTDYAFHLDGRFIVFLANGQIWQQIEGDTDKAHFKKGAPNKVTISRGAFGSYGLQLNDLAKAYKVKRLK